MKAIIYLCLLFYKVNSFSPVVNILENNQDLIILRTFLNDASEIFVGNGSVLSNDFAQLLDESSPPESLGSWQISHIYLYTRNYRQGKDFELVDPRNVSSIKYSHFRAGKTYVIVHGFIGYGLEKWIIQLKDKLLQKEDCNVLSVDWPAGEKWFLPTYISAAQRVPSVGNSTSSMLRSFMKFKGLTLATVHCIGHSLGAHVCGFAGKPFKGRVGRISGLDPAGPLFHNVSASQRLGIRDASYVDVIHSNACKKWPYWTDCYGLNEDVGHSNFYPNGGQHQPGCSSKNTSLGGDIGCDHERAYKFYIASLDFGTTGNDFLARPCDSWTTFTLGNCSCGSRPQFMGWNVNSRLIGRFFLRTLRSYPFGMEDHDCIFDGMWDEFMVIYVILVSSIFTLFIVGAGVCAVCFARRRNQSTYSVI